MVLDVCTGSWLDHVEAKQCGEHHGLALWASTGLTACSSCCAAPQVCDARWLPGVCAGSRPGPGEAGLDGGPRARAHDAVPPRRPDGAGAGEEPDRAHRQRLRLCARRRPVAARWAAPSHHMPCMLHALLSGPAAAHAAALSALQEMPCVWHVTVYW